MNRIKNELAHFRIKEHTDPTASSRVVLPSEFLEKDGFNKKGRDIIKDSAGERFHEIRRHPATQQFISRILKVFFNVADVVKIDNKYYSREPHLAGITKKKEKDKVMVDIKIINFIFNDSDRFYFSCGEPHNLIHENGKHLFFDFECCEYFWQEFNRDNFNAWCEELVPSGLVYLLYKLKSMSSYFHSDPGKSQVEAAYKATGYKIDTLFMNYGKFHSFNDFYDELLKRIDTMYEIVDRVVADDLITK